MNNFSSGLDMYFDDTKKKLKRRLALDRSIEAIALNVRNYNKTHPKDNSCMQLRIGADMYELNSADGLREKKSWCAKLRQAINRGNQIVVFVVSTCMTHLIQYKNHNTHDDVLL